MAKKRKEKIKEKASKISTIPTYIAKFYSKYSVCAMSLHSKFSFLLCNSKLNGK
jgi:hypothetical protein